MNKVKVLHFIKKGIALLLVLLVLTSSSGLAIDAHYCKEKLANIAVWGSAKSCIQTPAQEKISDYSNHTGSSKITKKSCCGSKKGFDKTEFTTDFPSQKIIKHSLNYYQGNSLKNDVKEIKTFSTNASFKPPRFDKDILVIYQNFRI